LKVVERSALVTFSAAQMFALVDDVARYPEFLPWCTGAQVAETAPSQRLATVQVARGAFKTQFTTRNIVQSDSSIHMELVEGPFSHLTGLWNFDPLGDRGSRVVFKIAFQFKNPLMAAAFNPVFESVCDKIVDAFVARAQQMYR
jgi:ribosome-associated toxin RatA of RatAB toxin-antitoxin module